MSLRSEKVSELDSWSTGSLTSVRQADNCSCGPFVLLVSNAAVCNRANFTFMSDINAE